MADHGTVEYASATGNDYPAHELTYEHFVHFTYVGILHIVCILLGLAVGGVKGDWLLASVILLLAIFGAIPGLASRSRAPSTAVFVICFLIFVYATVS
ncbi:MAG TPA: aa3-type cytochrome c oxidase subunit IV [Pseudolabrys sp.]|nr:aa3-type cytochrome c oxidase subunit IV [Pseudolabrys sp.]